MSDTTGPVWTNAELKRRVDDLALGHSVTGPFLSRVYDAMLVMSMEAQARLNAAEAERDLAVSETGKLRDGVTKAVGMAWIPMGNPDDPSTAYHCPDDNDIVAFVDTLRAERDALRQELTATLDVAIARGVSLGYEDDDCRARYAELTGEEWSDSDD